MRPPLRSPFATLYTPPPARLVAGTVLPREGRDDVVWQAALREAWQGVGRTAPNPPVGAVIVLGDKVVATGFHARAGRAHAEVAAIQSAASSVRGATMYVTLEPCSHFGRTPPCADRIIAEGIRRVVVGTRDPDPRVHGRGLNRLRAAGIDVELAPRRYAEACRTLLAPFSSGILRGRPWVVVKVAATLDGRVAAASGQARWITGDKSRRLVHALRDRVDAVVVGARTAMRDRATLTVRHAAGRKGQNPLRVVLDPRLSTPTDTPLLQGFPGDKDPGGALVFHGPAAAAAAADWPASAAREEVSLDGTGRLDLAEVLARLGARGLRSVLVEPGPLLFESLLRQGLADEVWWFTAPKLLGADALPVFGPNGAASPDDALGLGPPVDVVTVGNDTLSVFCAQTAGDAGGARVDFRWGDA